jgi:FKBP-type peptidyl-prolyl cis-trans isomerase FkpA
MNFSRYSLAAITLLTLFASTSCLKDDSEELRAAEKKTLANYILSNNITVQPSETGLYYIETVAGTGDSSKLNSWMEINYTCRLVSDNSVVMTSDKQVAKDNNIFESIYYGPTRLILGKISYKGLNEGLAKMREGGKARLIFPSDLGLGSASSSAIPSYSSLIFDVELVKVIPDMKAYETGLMTSFLDLNDFSPDSTASGIYFKQTKEGTGDLPDQSDFVTVTYAGRLLNGSEFDASAKSFTLTIGNGQVIPGFEEGVKLIRKDGAGTVVIPYYYGYGEYGRTDSYYRTVIPPFSTLVFDITVTGITKF